METASGVRTFTCGLGSEASNAEDIRLNLAENEQIFLSPVEKDAGHRGEH